jgi:enterochelin esterase-like enzyme
MSRFVVIAPAVVAVVLAAVGDASAQGRFGPPPPQFNSPEVSAERTITFRIHAPGAEAVRLSSTDLPDVGFGAGVDMKKGENDVWEVTVGPVPAGAYRYRFDVDGVSVVDPRNTAASETNSNVMSLVIVPGSDVYDLKEVPHGAVAEVNYYSQSLKRFRRMHVYTPPGYENGKGAFPILYLLHGAMDNDDAWSTVGRAGEILDNLIAAGDAKPMIVVMPSGHTGPFTFGPDSSLDRQMDEFSADFMNDVKPLVERNYRVIGDRDHRAIAGLSMGGMQTLNIAFGDLKDYGYVGVFSSGIFGITGFGGRPPSTEWEEQHRAVLDDADLKPGLHLVWFATGSEDFLRQTSTGTVDMLKEHGFDVTYVETGGGHTWINWRDYLSRFAPQLFQ